MLHCLLCIDPKNYLYEAFMHGDISSRLIIFYDWQCYEDCNIFVLVIFSPLKVNFFWISSYFEWWWMWEGKNCYFLTFESKLFWISLYFEWWWRWEGKNGRDGGRGRGIILHVAYLLRLLIWYFKGKQHPESKFIMFCAHIVSKMHPHFSLALH